MIMTDSYEKILKLETTPEAIEATVQYLARLMKPFLQTLEPVLICYPDEGPASLGGIFKEAIIRCEATPVFWGPDYRWKELLRIAFDTHANTLVGHPQVVLGLMKLAKYTKTPLYIYDMIVSGDPFPHWMVDGLKAGLDCNIWGCYAVHSGPIVGGFSCTQAAGIHIREDVFVPRAAEADHAAVSKWKRIQFVSAKDSSIAFDPDLQAIVHYQPCSCGCDDPRVMDTKPVSQDAFNKQSLDELLLTWSSILDYRVEYGESGTALELVVFPGEPMPKLPSVAKLNIRLWNPAEDIPFGIADFLGKNQEI
jgi:hypothetical protein